MRAPDFAGKGPKPPVTLQDSQRPLVRDSGLSSSIVRHPGLAEPLCKYSYFYVGLLALAETLGKDFELQSIPGELSLAANSESLDDALCATLMSSHDGEDEARLMVQPLKVLYPSVEKEMVFPNWVIRCAEQFHSKVGITYIGHKWQYMALLTFIEKERLKELETQSPSTSKRNREIKNLESSINYDNREGQSSRGKRKGKGSKVVL